MTYTTFILILAISLICGLAIGLYAFADLRKLPMKTIIRGIKNNWKYVLVLILILLAVYIENITNEAITALGVNDYTHLIYQLSFNGAVVWAVQNGLRSNFLDWTFIFIYLYSYIFLLLFTPLMYMVRDDRKRMREYTLAFAINYAVLIPFYIFFAVRTPGYFALSPAQPILYSQPNLIKFISAFDPLDNCFPSGHVSGPVTIFLLLLPLRKNSAYKFFAYFILAMCILIGLSVLYLGIHWFIDIVFGILLAIFAVWLVRSKRFMRWFNKISKSLKSLISKKQSIEN
ncbi:MAG: phosphatase PAP2 family protein [Thermoplasmata archaeon]|nr:phosphatase PAP2 family protein [Thermoplasmata archaeon]